MTKTYDVAGIGNAIVDVLAPADDAFLLKHNIAKGVMTLIDEFRAEQLLKVLGKGVEAAGGSAANTMAGVASLGGTGVYIGKVKRDRLGESFARLDAGDGPSLRRGLRGRRPFHGLLPHCRERRRPPEHEHLSGREPRTHRWRYR